MAFIPYLKDSFRGGISDESTRGLKGSFKYAFGADIHKRRDSLSANYAMLNIGTSSGVNFSPVSDLIKYTVNSRDGSTYAFGSKGSVYAISGKDTDPVVTFVYQVENETSGEVKGAAEWTESDGNTYLYWATDTRISRRRMNGQSDTDLRTGDTLGWATGAVDAGVQTNLESADWHPMKNASGNLMIGNNNFLAMIDYQGNYTNEAVNLRPGNIVKTLEERDDYVLIGTVRVDESEEGHIWSWITTALNWVQKKKIPVKGVNALIDNEQLLLQGGTAGELFFSDFANTAPLNSVPLVYSEEENRWEGGQCNPGGVDILNDLSLFGIYGVGNQSGIYSYGRRMMNRPFALNHEFRLSETSKIVTDGSGNPEIAGNTIDEIGAIWVNSTAVFASWQVTNDGSATYYGIDKISTSTRATARVEGLEFSGGQPHLDKEYRTEKVVMEPLPSGTSISMLYKTDRVTTGGDSSAGAGWKYARVASGSATTFTLTGATEAEFIINDKGRVFETGLEVNPSGVNTPEIIATVGYIGSNTQEH